MGKSNYNAPIKNGMQQYLQPNTNSPSKTDPVRQRVQMLNAGQIQPGDGDPQFAVRMNAALEKERQKESELKIQNAMMRDQFMNSLPKGEDNAMAGYIAPPAGMTPRSWLIQLSRRSPQGKLQMGINQMQDAELVKRLTELQNNPMPSEVALPGTGWKGHAQNVMNYMFGRGRAM